MSMSTQTICQYEQIVSVLFLLADTIFVHFPISYVRIYFVCNHLKPPLLFDLHSYYQTNFSSYHHCKFYVFSCQF